MTNQPDNEKPSEEDLMKMVEEVLKAVFDDKKEEDDPNWTVDKETRDSDFPEEAEEE